MTLRLGDAVCFVTAAGAKRGALVAQLLEGDRLDLVVLGAGEGEPPTRRVEAVPRKSATVEGAYYEPYPLQAEPAPQTPTPHEAPHKETTAHEKAKKK